MLLLLCLANPTHPSAFILAVTSPILATLTWRAPVWCSHTTSFFTVLNKICDYGWVVVLRFACDSSTRQRALQKKGIMSFSFHGGSAEPSKSLAYSRCSINKEINKEWINEWEQKGKIRGTVRRMPLRTLTYILSCKCNYLSGEYMSDRTFCRKIKVIFSTKQQS